MKTCLRRLAAMLLCLGMLLVLSACGESRMEQKMIFSMDTTMTLTAYGNKAGKGLDAACNIINSMNNMLDPEQSYSMVYAMNHANGESVVVSGQIAEMISTAREVYERSGGALDLTIYPVIERWGFTNRNYYVPTGEELAEDLARLCFDELELDTFSSLGSYTVKMPADGMISFGAIAKGCAAQNAIDAMRAAGVKSAVISLGGNMQTLGLKPDGSNWNIAVTDPNNPASYLGVLSVGECAVVTSGTYQRYFVQNGKTYHHLLKPSTGMPVNNTLTSLTVVTKDGTTADALSTALFVLGEQKALSYWRSYGRSGDDAFEMIMITSDNEVICTRGLIEVFTLSNENYSLSFKE